MIKRNNYSFVKAENLLPILHEIQRRIAIRQVGPIATYISTKGISVSTAKCIVHAMFDLKVISFKDSVPQSYMYFNKVDWNEAPPTIELAQLIIDQMHENTKIARQKREVSKIYSGKLAEKKEPEKKENTTIEKKEVMEEIKVFNSVEEKKEAQDVNPVLPVNLSAFSDKELADELRNRGWTVTAQKMVEL